MTTLCGVCGQPKDAARLAHTVCQPCEDWTRDRLNEVEHLWLELPDHLERGRGHAGPRVSGNTPDGSPSPLSEAVLDLIGPGGVHDRLAPHNVAIRRARGLAGTPVCGGADHRVATIVRHLRHHLPWAAQHHDLYALAVELQQLTGEMRAATGQHSERDETTKALGTPCPIERIGDDGAAAVCGGTLRYDRTARTVRCDDCRHTLDQTQWTAAAVGA